MEKATSSIEKATPFMEKATLSRDTRAFDYHYSPDDFEDALEKFIKRDHLQSIKFIFSNYYLLDSKTTRKAIRCNAVKYLVEQKLSDDECMIEAVKHSLAMTKIVVNKRKCWIAKYLIDEMGICVNSHVVSDTIDRCRPELLLYIVEKNADRNYYELICTIIVKFLLEHGVEYHSMYASLAACRGVLNLLIFFHQQGYEISENTYSYHHNIKDYLHKHKLGMY